MNPSDDLLEFIRGWERLMLTAYQDDAGVWTIGYGHTAGVRPGMQITEAQAEQFLWDDTSHAAACVTHCFAIALEQNEFDVCIDFVFCFGSGRFVTSTLLDVINKGQLQLVPAQLMRWINETKVQADGSSVLVPVDGLRKRRAAECNMWMVGDYSGRP